MIRTRTGESPEVDLTPMIDVVFQLIIFFMVVMAIAVVYGVAIKFPSGKSPQEKKPQKEKRLVVYVQADWIEENHQLVQDGILKLNGEDIALVTSVNDPNVWEKQREHGYNYLKGEMGRLIKEEGFKDDMLLIMADVKTYHGKIMKVIDIGKELEIEGFSLVPPQI
jgi:biopolymer transport protein ExbD